MPPESQGQKLLLMGDLIHVPTVQLDHPSVTVASDGDHAEATASRIKVFDQAARERTLVAGVHIRSSVPPARPIDGCRSTTRGYLPRSQSRPIHRGSQSYPPARACDRERRSISWPHRYMR